MLIRLILFILLLGIPYLAYAEKQYNDQIRYIVAAHLYVADKLQINSNKVPLPMVKFNSEDIIKYGTNNSVLTTMGIYFPNNIYLHTDWTYPEDMPWLVHEMTHHFQWWLKLKYDCFKQREKLAYEIQNMYSIEHNTPLLTSQWIIDNESKCK